MYVIVFRSRVRAEADLEEMAALGEKMYGIAHTMPGFISYKDFAAEDGETVTIVEFESLDTLQAWRDHPEHRIAQHRGRTEFFSEYHIQVCSPVRDYAFHHQEVAQPEIKGV